MVSKVKQNVYATKYKMQQIYIYNKRDTSIINVVFILNKKSNYCLKEIDHNSILHIYPNNEVNKCVCEVMLLVLGQQNL